MVVKETGALTTQRFDQCALIVFRRMMDSAAACYKPHLIEHTDLHVMSQMVLFRWLETEHPQSKACYYPSYCRMEHHSMIFHCA